VFWLLPAAWAYKVRPPRKPRRCIVRLYKEMKNDLETRLDVGRVTTLHIQSLSLSGPRLGSGTIKQDDAPPCPIELSQPRD